MTFAAWKPRLVPACALLACYCVAPGLVGWFMGANDAIFGRLTFSLLVQAGIALALARVFIGLQHALYETLAAWLAGYSQPQEKTRELSEKTSIAVVLVASFSVIWPPAGEMLPGGRIMGLLKISVLAYAGYKGFRIWKLAEPFLAAAHTVVPPADMPEPPAAGSERRCAKCGQRIEGSGKNCAFCGQPLAGN
jgi:hypothetical protein